MEFQGGSVYNRDEQVLSLLSDSARLEVESVYAYLNRPVSVPLDLVTLILSHVPLSSVKSVILTCKQWYECFKRADFWTKHVHRKLKPFYEENFPALSSNEISQLLNSFHPFMWRDESMKVQLEWLFVVNWVPAKFKKFDTIPCFWLSSENVGYQLDVVFDKLETGAWAPNVISSGHFKKKAHEDKWVEHGLYITFIRKGEPLCPIYDRKTCIDGKTITRYIECTTPKGDCFFGQSLLEKVWPHGAGRWIFSDGTTLTGDHVAFDGLPHGEGREDETPYFAGEPRKKKRKVGEK